MEVGRELNLRVASQTLPPVGVINNRLTGVNTRREKVAQPISLSGEGSVLIVEDKRYGQCLIHLLSTVRRAARMSSSTRRRDSARENMPAHRR